MQKSRPKMIGQSRSSQTMNYCWNFVGNSRVHVVVPRGPRLLPLPPFTLYMLAWTNSGSGCNLLKHTFDTQDMVASVSNREMALLLLVITGKFAAYFILLNLTSIISSVHDSQSELEEDLMLLSSLLELCGSISSGFELVVLGVNV